MTRTDSWFARAAETPVSYILLIAYAVFMLPGERSNGLGEGSLHDWAMEHLAAVGADIQAGEPWRLLSYALVHGGFVHLVFNGMALVWLGPPIERALGGGRFFSLYAVTALGGGITGVWWHGPWDPLVGGSGSLFGMMGAILALNMRAGRHLLDFLEQEGTRSFLSLILVNLILGWVIPHVSNAAHVGGLLVGFVFTFVFLVPGRGPRDGLARAARAGWFALLLSTTIYTCVPTARADYLLRRLIETSDPHERESVALALEGTARDMLPLKPGAPNTRQFWLGIAAGFDSFDAFLEQIRK